MAFKLLVNKNCKNFRLIVKNAQKFPRGGVNAPSLYTLAYDLFNTKLTANDFSYLTDVVEDSVWLET